MVFLTIYYMSWGLTYFYENSQLEISLISMRIRNLKSEKVIRYMQCAQVMEGLFQ